MGLALFGKAKGYEKMDQNEVREAMNFTSHDVIIIERALRTAMKYEIEEQRSRDYQEVLYKLQESANQALLLTALVTSTGLDGIRYDYDDSADLM